MPNSIRIRTTDGSTLNSVMQANILQLAGISAQDANVVYEAYNDKDQLAQNYIKRIKQVTYAFNMALTSQIAGRDHKARVSPKLDALQDHIESIEATHSKRIQIGSNSLADYQAVLADYVQHVSILLANELKIEDKLAVELLSKAEDYKVLSDLKPVLATVISTESVDAESQAESTHYVLMMEVPEPPLSESMIKEYLQAKPGSKDVPAWYKAMPLHQQEMFDVFMRDVNTGEELKEKMNAIPSKLRQLPGVPNSSRHVFAEFDAHGNIVARELDRFRSSMIAPRDFISKIDKNKDLRQTLTTNNLEHLIRAEAERLTNQFKQPDGSVKRNEVESFIDMVLANRPYLIQTLISPLIGSDFFIPDRKLYDNKQKAIASIRQNGVTFKVADQIFKFFPTIIDTNHPLNSARQISKTGTILESGNTAAEAKQLANLAIERAASSNITTDFLYEAALELQSLITINPGKDNQRELHLAALEEFITTRLGGFSYGSCVSGKDRKALETYYVDAIFIYINRYHQFPKYEDSTENRANFVNIYAQIFLSRHQQENAGQNAPGASGIKTPADYLPDDIKAEIIKKSGNPGILEETDRLASNNELDKVYEGAKKFTVDKQFVLAALTISMKSAEKAKRSASTVQVAGAPSSLQILQKFGRTMTPEARERLLSAHSKSQHTQKEVMIACVTLLQTFLHDRRWDSHGLGLFGTKTPDGVEKMRKVLPVNIDASKQDEESLKKIFSGLYQVANQRMANPPDVKEGQKSPRSDVTVALYLMINKECDDTAKLDSMRLHRAIEVVSNALSTPAAKRKNGQTGPVPSNRSPTPR